MWRIIPDDISILSVAVLADRAAAIRYSPNVRIADPAALGVFYREPDRSSSITLGAVALNRHFGWSGPRRPEGVLNDEGLRGADMADEPFPLVYEPF